MANTLKGAITIDRFHELMLGEDKKIRSELKAEGHTDDFINKVMQAWWDRLGGAMYNGKMV